MTKLYKKKVSSAVTLFNFHIVASVQKLAVMSRRKYLGTRCEHPGICFDKNGSTNGMTSF